MVTYSRTCTQATAHTGNLRMRLLFICALFVEGMYVGRNVTLVAARPPPIRSQLHGEFGQFGFWVCLCVYVSVCAWNLTFLPR